MSPLVAVGLAVLTSVMEDMERLYVINLGLDQETQYREPEDRSAMTLGRCLWVQPPSSWLEGEGEVWPSFWLLCHSVPICLLTLWTGIPPPLIDFVSSESRFLSRGELPLGSRNVSLSLLN